MSENLGYPMEELIPIVAKLTRQYTGNESTSVTYEKAQQLMEAVLYCINEVSMCGKEVLARKDMKAEDAYHMGRQMAAEKVSHMRELYNGMVAAFESYGNECCYDTLINGIPEFIKWYDVKFNPQNTILTLDYPLLVEIKGRTGIDAVYEYVRCVDLEQKFLHSFDDVFILQSLRSYCAEYDKMIENLCGIILPNVAAHVLLKKPFQQYGFTQEEYKKLSVMLSGHSQMELEQLLCSIITEAVLHMFGTDKEAANYFCSASGDIAVRIGVVTESGCLERLFLV